MQSKNKILVVISKDGKTTYRLLGLPSGRFLQQTLDEKGEVSFQIHMSKEQGAVTAQNILMWVEAHSKKRL